MIIAAREFDIECCVFKPGMSIRISRKQATAAAPQIEAHRMPFLFPWRC